MEGNRGERGDEVGPQLLDLIPKDSEWVFNRRDDTVAGEARKLELSLGLGPPGSAPATKTSSFLHRTTTQAMNMKKKPTASPPPHENPHKRSGQAQVVGWPPIRSSRKNLSTSSSKPISTESPQNVKNDIVNNKTNYNNKNDNNNNGGEKRGMFVKINMEGVPIGRKLDLNAYDNYHTLEDVVDHLFRGLLAAQRNSSEEKAIRGLLDGSGEYTLVYEDNEGDRMLVGDVPWNMFVSTVKRLRVLKSSELSSLSLVSKATT